MIDASFVKAHPHAAEAVGGKPMSISDISPILFSEVMCDIDLAVSVAYVGGADPDPPSICQTKGSADRIETIRKVVKANGTKQV